MIDLPVGCTRVTIDHRHPEVFAAPCPRVAIWRVLDTGELFCGWHRFHIPAGAAIMRLAGPDHPGKAIIIPGCALKENGRAHDRDGTLRPAGSRDGYGWCTCGAHSDWLDKRSARRDWHNDHKKDVRDRLARQDHTRA